MTGQRIRQVLPAAMFFFWLLASCTGQDKIAEGKKLLDAKQFEQAESAFDAILKADAGNPEAYWGRAKARMGLVRYEEAITDLQQAIDLAEKQDPEPSPLGRYYLDRGLSHYALAQFPVAAEYFQKAIDLEHEPAEGYAYLGVCQGNMNQPVEAVTSLNKSIKMRPDDHFARANRGYYNSLLGDNRTAITDFTEAIRLQPDDKTSYLNRGYTHIGMNDYPKAIEDFKKALEIDPEFLGAIVYMGIAYTNTGQSAEALNWLNRAIERQPENPTLFYYRGTARINLGQVVEGCTDLKHAFDNGESQAATMMQEFCPE